MPLSSCLPVPSGESARNMRFGSGSAAHPHLHHCYHAHANVGIPLAHQMYSIGKADSSQPVITICIETGKF